MASNFLGKYLEENGYAPEIIFVNCPDEVSQFIGAHVFVRLGDYYIDITRNQFNDFNGRVLIEGEYGTLAGLMKRIKRIDPSDVIERKVDISDARMPAYELYNFIKSIADVLMKES